MIEKKVYIKMICSCVVMFVILILLLRFMKIKYFDQAGELAASKEISYYGNEQIPYSLTPESGMLSQKFEVTTDALAGFALRVARNQETVQGELAWELLDHKGNFLFGEHIPVRELPSQGLYQKIFEEVQQETQGKTYELRFQLLHMEREESLLLMVNPDDRYVRGELRDDTGKIDGNLRLRQIYSGGGYLKKVFYFLGAAVFLLVFGLYAMVVIKKFRMEFVFLAMVILTGLVYMLLLRPGSIPDEPSHYRTSYAYANQILGKEGGRDQYVVMESSDYNFHRTTMDSVPMAEAYQDVFTDLWGKAEDGEMLSTERYPIQSPWYLYVGGTVGITLGRICGWNGLTVFYLGRLMNLLLFSGLAFFAIRKIPFYKMSVFVICLLPMSIQMAASMSYDGIILGIVLVFVAEILNCAFSEMDHIPIQDLVVLTLSSVLIGGCKGGAYIPICGLLFLLSKKKFSKGKTRWIYIGGTMAATLLLFSITSLTVVSSSIGASAVNQEGEPLYTVGWIFQNQGGVLQLLSNTLYEKGDFILQSLIGKDLGWINIPVHMVVIFGFVLVLLLTCVHVKIEKKAVIFEGKEKMGILACIILSVGMIVAAMMLSWTPKRLNYIEGIQGRYFIPLLLLLVLCLKNHILVLRRSIEKGLIITVGWLHVLVFVNVIGTTLAVLLAR